MTIKAVIFDLDETLFDRTSSLKSFVAAQIVRHEALQFDDPDIVISKFLELDKRGRVSKLDVYRALLQTGLFFESDIPENLFREYENEFWRFAIPFAGINQMFADLKVDGVKTGIITNGHTHIQLRTLLALNLDKLVDDYLISDSEGTRKPDQAIFELAVQRLDVETEECMFVGDSAVSDICGAMQAGMKRRVVSKWIHLALR